MRRPQAYAVWTSPERTVERDCLVCSHCQRVIFVEPRADPASLGGVCRACMKHVCPTCADARDKGGPCVPWEKAMEKMEARARLLKACGIG